MAQEKSVLEGAANAGTLANPEWARIPHDGQNLEGLYRGQIFALIRKGQIKTAAIKAPGAARTGMRLVHVPSLRSWISSHVEGCEVAHA